MISAMGSSGLDAAFYGKPSIVFGEMFYTILPSVTYVEKLNDLPNTIRSSLQNTVRLEDVKKFLAIFYKNSFDFDINRYMLDEANTFFHNGQLVDVEISDTQMKSFIENNADMFSILVKEHIKRINELNV